MLRGGKSRSRKQRGGAPGDAIVEQEDGTLQKYTLDELKEMLSPSALTTPASPVTEVGSVSPPVVQPASQPAGQTGGKRKGRKATKKGGDMGAGLLTAGTLLLIQAAAKSLLAKKQSYEGKQGRRGRPQRGGQPIESRPASFGATASFGGLIASGGEESSLVKSSLMGGSMCGVPPAPAPQAGGKKKTQRRSKKQSGGALDTTGDLNTAFSMLGSGMHSVAFEQAGAAAVATPPFQVSGEVSQAGGKKKTQRRSKKQSGGALNLSGELEAAFAQQSVAGAIPLSGAHVAPTVPGALTALHPQTGGRKRSAASKSKSKK